MTVVRKSAIDEWDWLSNRAADALLAMDAHEIRPELLALYSRWHLGRYTTKFARFFGWPEGVLTGNVQP